MSIGEIRHMVIAVFIFFLSLIRCPNLIADEEFEVGHAIFHDEAEHEHEGEEHYEAGGGGERVEEEHHHHHASHTQTTTTAAPVITSAAQQVGGVPLTLSQEAGLIKANPVTENKPKPTNANSYRPIRAPLANDFISFDGDVQVEQDPVTQFFRIDIWNDVTFHKSLLEEYNNFFDREMNRLVQTKKELKKRKSREKESGVNTPLFKEALNNFKESNEGIQLQIQLESYITIIERFIKSQKSQYRKTEKVRFQQPPALEVSKLEKIAIVGDEVTFYALTYADDTESPVYVTEKSMRLLFGQSFFSAFLMKQNVKNVTIFVPYKSVLDVFNDKDRLFSLSLLRSKIYYTERTESEK